METSVGVILKKTFSLALIFNALITVAAVAGIIFGFYMAYPYWQPYAPWLINGNLFWLALAAAIINIFPSAHRQSLAYWTFPVSPLPIRLLCSAFFLCVCYHFYFYSFAQPVLVESNSLAVNAGRVFELAGLTLL